MATGVSRLWLSACFRIGLRGKCLDVGPGFAAAVLRFIGRNGLALSAGFIGRGFLYFFLAAFVLAHFCGNLIGGWKIGRLFKSGQLFFQRFEVLFEVA